MSAADTVKEFARHATTATLAKNVIGLLDKKSSLPAEQVMTSQELRIIYDRLRHTLDLIPLSTSESHPRLFQVRQNILKQMEVLTSMILEAAKKEVKIGGHKENEKPIP
ncbi:MAG: hypothetical protein ACLQAH_09040 [Limisphaerales bacterium]